MTTETTPADTLRRAATMVRELATTATPGPWGLIPERPFSRYRVVMGAGEMSPVAGTVLLADAAHIAAWSPPAALAVADWLESEAGTFDRHAIFDPHALALARALLGEA